MAQQIDYSAVLSDLERQQRLMNERFGSAIAAIKQIIALGAGGQQVGLLDSLAPPKVASAAGGGPYAGLGMIEAAKAHLKRAGVPVPNIALARALEEGGFPHRSKNFPNTLNSVLHRRAKTVGDVRKIGNTWTLGSPQ